MNDVNNIIPWIGPCVHGADPFDRCDECDYAGPLKALTARVYQLEAELSSAMLGNRPFWRNRAEQAEAELAVAKKENAVLLALVHAPVDDEQFTALRTDLAAAQERVEEHRKSAAYFQRRLEDTLDLYRPRLEAAERRCTELEAALKEIRQECRDGFIVCSRCSWEEPLADLDLVRTVNAALSARPTDAAPATVWCRCGDEIRPGESALCERCISGLGLDDAQPAAPARFMVGGVVDHAYDSGPREVSAAPEPEKTGPVCSMCNDTHVMNDRGWPCTHCPVPCERCRQRLGAFCKMTPCPCSCHAAQPRRPQPAAPEPAKWVQCTTPESVRDCLGGCRNETEHGRYNRPRASRAEDDICAARDGLWSCQLVPGHAGPHCEPLTDLSGVHVWIAPPPSGGETP